MSPHEPGRQALAKPCGVILAGGRARRMGGQVKALLPLGNKPLLNHVIERVAPQVEQLCLSVEIHSSSFEPFGLAQVADDRPDGGPLGGLLAALSWMPATSDWLLVVPCDAPFLPDDLAESLLCQAVEASTPVAIADYAGEPQPACSIWHRGILPELEQAVTGERMAGFKQFLQRVPSTHTKWADSTPAPFFNINDPKTLLEAERLLVTHSEKTSCSV